MSEHIVPAWPKLRVCQVCEEESCQQTKNSEVSRVCVCVCVCVCVSVCVWNPLSALGCVWYANVLVCMLPWSKHNYSTLASKTVFLWDIIVTVEALCKLPYTYIHKTHADSKFNKRVFQHWAMYQYTMSMYGCGRMRIVTSYYAPGTVHLPWHHEPHIQ